jgi:AcrR family transcriptional regulator
MPALHRPHGGEAVEASVPDPPWRTPRTARAARQPLTRERIVDAALRVLDRDGLDAVSMRRVGQELATGAASLYVHVANKDELLELMLDRVAGEIRVPAPDPARWREQVEELGRAIRGALLAHPGIARVSVAGVPAGPNALALTEGALAILRAGGLTERAAAWAVDRLILYVSADAVEESAERARRLGPEPVEPPGERRARVGAWLAGLPPDRFPNTVALVDAFMASGDDRFEFGLGLLVRGLATLATGTGPGGQRALK